MEIVYCLETEQEIHRKRVKCYGDGDLLYHVDATRDHLQFWMGAIVYQDREAFRRWWVEDEDGNSIYESRTLGVGLNKRGKVQRVAES